MLKLPDLDYQAAWQEVSKILPVTLLSRSNGLSEIYNKNIRIKWENKHHTGSFKERGVVTLLAKLGKAERRDGICAASAGNHALALSYHSKRTAVKCTVVMPRHAPLVKVQAAMKYGAEVIQTGESFYESAQYAEDFCKKKGIMFVSPFDHIDIIAGQSTCGLEILEQAPDLDSIIVPVGGGGLLSGIARVIKEKRPSVYVIGVQSEWAVSAQTTVDFNNMAIPPVSIADGIAIKRIGKITAPFLDSTVDLLINVNEHEIASAVIQVLELEKVVIEGAAAAGIAALAKKALPDKYKSPVIVATGSNIDMNLLSRLIDRDMNEKGRLLRIAVSVPDRPGSLHKTTGLIAENGANVLQVSHDRSFSQIPGNVEITFLLEVRSSSHKEELKQTLRDHGFVLSEIKDPSKGA